jgi:hypothetical protein
MQQLNPVFYPPYRKTQTRKFTLKTKIYVFVTGYFNFRRFLADPSPLSFEWQMNKKNTKNPIKPN